MAPSTPPPPSSDVLAAFTMASTCSLVMSPETGMSCAIDEPSKLFESRIRPGVSHPVHRNTRGGRDADCAASIPRPTHESNDHGKWVGSIGAGSGGHADRRGTGAGNRTLGGPGTAGRA